MASQQMRNDDVPEIAVSIPKDILQELKYLSELMGGVPLSIALRHAIATDSYIQGELKKNSKFLIKKQGGSTQEISWTAAKDIEKILQSL